VPHPIGGKVALSRSVVNVAYHLGANFCFVKLEIFGNHEDDPNH